MALLSRNWQAYQAFVASYNPQLGTFAQHGTSQSVIIKT